jgi:hypothetical protein
MKMLMVALLATSAVSLTAPVAMAQSYRDGGSAQRTWDRGDQSYGRRDAYSSRAFYQEYRELQSGIRHGLRDGSFSRDQARLFTNALQAIGDRAEWMRRNGNFDGRDLQGRLNQVRGRMQLAHSQGHDRLDRADRYGDNRYDDRRYGDRR